MFHLRLMLLLIFFLDDLSIDISVELKFATIVVLPSVSPFMSLICFVYLGVLTSSCICPLIIL